MELIKERVNITFEKLKEYGIDYSFLYSNAEQEEVFKIPLDEVFNKLGVKVVFDASLNTSGKTDIEKKIIYINDSESSQRKLFTLAHELYHFLNNQNFNRDGNKNLEEISANNFSADFLMPRDILEKKFNEFEKNTLRTACYFRVSLYACSFRLLNSGIVTTL